MNLSTKEMNLSTKEMNCTARGKNLKVRRNEETNGSPMSFGLVKMAVRDNVMKSKMESQCRPQPMVSASFRSEERRVGKECA